MGGKNLSHEIILIQISNTTKSLLNPIGLLSVVIQLAIAAVANK